MAGFKDFTDGNVLTAGEVDGYLMRQTVMRFATTTAMTASLVAGIREKGMLAYCDDTTATYQFDGTSTWWPQESMWTAFTTVWNGPTALSIGNGTISCRWRYVGGRVHAHYELVRGSTTNVGASSYSWSLPVEAKTANYPLGTGMFRDNSPFAEYGMLAVGSTSTTMVLINSATNTRASNTVPVAVATGDLYFFDISYEPLNGVT